MEIMVTLPVDAPVQLVPPGKATLHVESLIDPSGDPITVLDIDLGFTLTGWLDLPGWLSGKGIVSLAADQIGGPIDKVIGSVTVNITGATSPNDPPNIRYYWKINVKSPVLPDASAMYQFGVIFAFQTNAGGHTDIGGFYDLGAFLVV
jgi:hypothetical protein